MPGFPSAIRVFALTRSRRIASSVLAVAYRFFVRRIRSAERKGCDCCFGILGRFLLIAAKPYVLPPLLRLAKKFFFFLGPFVSWVDNLSGLHRGIKGLANDR